MTIVHHHHVIADHPDYGPDWPLGLDVRITRNDCYICSAASPTYRRSKPFPCGKPIEECIAEARRAQATIRLEAATP
jgi:hypothetical protein